MIFFGVRPAACRNGDGSASSIALITKKCLSFAYTKKSPPQGLSEELHADKDFWEDRYRSIVNLEEHLHCNNTRIIKFFLHISEEEQRKRFLERIEEPHKNWKFTLSDIHERQYWPEYMKAYEACLNATSTPNTPWYIVPADDKKNARLIISQIILDRFKGLKMAYPTITEERRKELKTIRKKLEGS